METTGIDLATRKLLAQIAMYPQMHICFPLLVEAFMAGFATARKLQADESAEPLPRLFDELSNIHEWVLLKMCDEHSVFLGFVSRGDLSASESSSALVDEYRRRFAERWMSLKGPVDFVE